MTGPIPITTRADARAALGERVRITGTVQRDKLGDVVLTADLDILCPDHRFADEKVGTELTVAGTLRLMRLPEATVSETGAISQGVMPGTPPRFAMDDCVEILDSSEP